MLLKLIQLLFIIASGVLGQNKIDGKWEFYAFSGLFGMLSYGRLDPIVSPGSVSSHVHQIQGGNSFGANFDFNTARSQGTCATVDVQDDQSNYWSPAMYSNDGAGNYALMLSKFHVYYQFSTFSYDPNNKNGSTQRYPFPPGFKMLAGNMMQRSINTSDPRSTSTRFNCIVGNGTVLRSYDIRDFQKMGVKCQYLQATTGFPSCWDGVADNSDNSHVAYPGYLYVCPKTHPYALMFLNFEWYWSTQDFPFDAKRTDNWVVSTGDTSGFSFHGDFANGWNPSLLQSAINSCNVTENGIEKCTPFSSSWNKQIPPCMPTGLYPNEPVGLDNKNLTSLPGCNPLWTDNSTKPTCNSPAPAPPINLSLGPDLTNWNYVSCPMLWQGKGMILTAKKVQNWNNMTVDVCLDQCKGYRYAMMEWGNSCFCDNAIQSNGTIVSDPNYACQIRCPGNYLQNCGGFGSGSLYEAASYSGSNSTTSSTKMTKKTTKAASSTSNLPTTVRTPITTIRLPTTLKASTSKTSTVTTKPKTTAATATTR